MKTKQKTKINNILIADGQNVLKYHFGKNRPQNIEIVRYWAERNGIQIFFVLPGIKLYREMFQHRADIVYTPYSKYDDLAILEFAKDCNAAILSNDRFREFRTQFNDLDFTKVFTYEIIGGTLVTEATNYFDSLYYNITSSSDHLSIIGAVQ